MSKLSIYENRWIEMVFEEKNKEYGAYQMRRESDKITAIAFITGLFFISSLVLLVVFIKNFTAVQTDSTPPIEVLDEVIQLSNYNPIQPQKPQKKIIPITKKTTEVEPKKQLFNPTIVKPIDSEDNIAKNAENKEAITEKGIENSTGINSLGSDSGTGTGTGKSTITTNTDNTNTNAITTTNNLDKLPEFPGGIKKFYAYVGNTFESPELNLSKTVKIYVSFVIEKDGTITDIKVNRDPGYGLGQEAIRVLKSLKTKWSPGYKNGQPTRTLYNLPILVEIK